ncbi:MAG: class I SAM-dependent methyltransferase [Solirubrobacteraceae bacterium]
MTDLADPPEDPYSEMAATYQSTRREDPRIAQLIHGALADARSVVNVGAGSGAYEPRDREVIAVEPSPEMIAQRPPDSAPAMEAYAESLPLEAGSVDAAMACLTLHHWSDWRIGVQELRRVARKRIVILTFDPAWAGRFWLVRDYLPRLARLDSARFPTLAEQCAAAGAAARAARVPIPHDCEDGFLGAYWRRPHAYLDEQVRSNISAFGLLAAGEIELAMHRLAQDLRSGHWARRNHKILGAQQIDLGYRLIVAELFFDRLRD